MHGRDSKCLKDSFFNKCSKKKWLLLFSILKSALSKNDWIRYVHVLCTSWLELSKRPRRWMSVKFRSFQMYVWFVVIKCTYIIMYKNCLLWLFYIIFNLQVSKTSYNFSLNY